LWTADEITEFLVRMAASITSIPFPLNLPLNEVLICLFPKYLNCGEETTKQNTNPVVFIPQANYTDQATAAADIVNVYFCG
jgi:hypothetical protein